MTAPMLPIDPELADALLAGARLGEVPHWNRAAYPSDVCRIARRFGALALWHDLLGVPVVFGVAQLPPYAVEHFWRGYRAARIGVGQVLNRGRHGPGDPSPNTDREPGAADCRPADLERSGVHARRFEAGTHE